MEIVESLLGSSDGRLLPPGERRVAEEPAVAVFVVLVVRPHRAGVDEFVNHLVDGGVFAVERIRVHDVDVCGSVDLK